MLPGLPFNKSSLQGRELEFIIQTISNGQFAGDQTFSKKCHRLLEEVVGVPYYYHHHHHYVVVVVVALAGVAVVVFVVIV